MRVTEVVIKYFAQLLLFCRHLALYSILNSDAANVEADR